MNTPRRIRSRCVAPRKTFETKLTARWSRQLAHECIRGTKKNSDSWINRLQFTIFIQAQNKNKKKISAQRIIMKMMDAQIEYTEFFAAADYERRNASRHPLHSYLQCEKFQEQWWGFVRLSLSSFSLHRMYRECAICSWSSLFRTIKLCSRVIN